MYTSGCPKNQNKCWNKIGSPPPAGSKKDVFKFRSVSNIVIAAAKTGKDNNSSTVVITTDQINKGTRSNDMPFHRIFATVEIKFNEPKIDEAPAKCNEKIAISTDGPEWAILYANGGYTVHPVPTPFSTNAEKTNIIIDGGNSQNLRLLRRGNAISGAPIINGVNQFPNPPIKIGITIKKIITNP